MSWIITSLLMFCASVILYLLIRKVQIQKIPNEVNTLFLFRIPCLIYLIFHFILKLNILIDFKLILMFLLAGFLFSYLGNKFSLIAMESAPNPGYVNAVNASSISLITLFSAFLFKDDFSVRKLVGILGVTAGLILLFI